MKFNPDNKFLQFMAFAADVFEINVLFFITCIPVFTIGVSFTAGYATALKLINDQSSSIHRLYFRKFKENFKQSTLTWLLALLLYAIFILDIFGARAVPDRTFRTIIQAAAVVGILLVTFVMNYALALIGIFDNTFKNTLSNALYLSFRYAPRSIAMTVVTASPVMVLLLWPSSYLTVLLLMMLIWGSGILFLNIVLMRDIFRANMDPKDVEKEEDPKDPWEEGRNDQTKGRF